MTMTDDRPDAPAPSAASSRANGIAARLAAVVEPLFGGRLPVRLKAWDGSVAGPADAPDRRAARPGRAAPAPAPPRRARPRPGVRHRRARRRGGPARRVPPRLVAARERGGSPVGRRLAAVAGGIRTAFDLGVVGLPPEPPGVAGPAPWPAPHAMPRPRRDRAPLQPVQRLLRADPRPAHGVLLRLLDSTDPAYTVEDAQRDKLDLVCRKLGIEPGPRHLDIGCGWGSLSLHAAESSARRSSA